jgi:hypothetical protein
MKIREKEALRHVGNLRSVIHSMGLCQIARIFGRNRKSQIFRKFCCIQLNIKVIIEY